MDIIDFRKCIDAERFLEILDSCLRTLEDLREEVRQEIYYDEL